MYRVVDANHSDLTRLPENASLINYSMLREFYSPVGFRSFSIKYVLEGSEKYTVNGNVFKVPQGQYLLANSHCEGDVYIESKDLVKGVCIDISPELLSEVVASHADPSSPVPDTALDRFFNSNDFVENTYKTTNTKLGRYLTHVGKTLNADPFKQREFTNEFFYTLAENLVADYMVVFKEYQNIRALRPSTRKDLYRKVSRGKEFLDECFSSRTSIADVAREATLSEYHFFRLFKSMYGISPHQYLVKQKLERAYELLKDGHGPVAAVSQYSGFPDVFSFSRTFKKHYGISPYQVLTGK